MTTMLWIIGFMFTGGFVKTEAWTFADVIIFVAGWPIVLGNELRKRFNP